MQGAFEMGSLERFVRYTDEANSYCLVNHSRTFYTKTTMKPRALLSLSYTRINDDEETLLERWIIIAIVPRWFRAIKKSQC